MNVHLKVIYLCHSVSFCVKNTLLKLVFPLSDWRHEQKRGRGISVGNSWLNLLVGGDWPSNDWLLFVFLSWILRIECSVCDTIIGHLSSHFYKILFCTKGTKGLLIKKWHISAPVTEINYCLKPESFAAGLIYGGLSCYFFMSVIMLLFLKFRTCEGLFWLPDQQC